MRALGSAPSADSRSKQAGHSTMASASIRHRSHMKTPHRLQFATATFPRWAAQEAAAPGPASSTARTSTRGGGGTKRVASKAPPQCGHDCEPERTRSGSRSRRQRGQLGPPKSERTARGLIALAAEAHDPRLRGEVVDRGLAAS